MKLYAAHRTILSSASSVFKELLMLQPHHKDPMLFMKDVSQADLKCLLEFVYLGETEISEDRIESFLKLGKDFNIKDLNSSPQTDDVKKESTEVEENSENYQMGENSKPTYDVPINTSNQKSHSKGDIKSDNNNTLGPETIGGFYEYSSLLCLLVTALSLTIKRIRSCRNIFQGDHQIQLSQLLETQHFTAKMSPFWSY